MSESYSSEDETELSSMENSTQCVQNSDRTNKIFQDSIFTDRKLVVDFEKTDFHSEQVKVSFQEIEKEDSRDSKKVDFTQRS